MNRELSPGKNGGDHNRGYSHGETSGRSWGPAGLTSVTDIFRNLHLRTARMGPRLFIRKLIAVLGRRPRLVCDRKRYYPGLIDN